MPWRDSATERLLQVLKSKRITKALHLLTSRRAGIVLAFHDISHERLSNLLMDISQQYTFISLSEFVNRLEKGRSTCNLAVITFDDGYGPVLESAAELAQLHKWPMTFFLPTRYLD